MNSLPRDMLLEIITKINTGHKEEIETLRNRLETYQSLYGETECSISNRFCTEELFICTVCKKLLCKYHAQSKGVDVNPYDREMVCCNSNRNVEQLGDYDLEMYERIDYDSYYDRDL